MKCGPLNEPVSLGSVSSCKRLIPACICFWLLTAQLSDAWHSFADQEAVPTINNTCLSSALKLPELLNLTACRIAATSLQKVRLTCSDKAHSSCNLLCASAWSSALRDLKGIIGTACPEAQHEVHMLDANLPTATVMSMEHMQLFEDTCMEATNQTECSWTGEYCSGTNPSILLTSPLCSKFSDGVYELPFLTWKTVNYYAMNSLGFLGGMAASDEAEYTNWACIYQNECPTIDDSACFKYSHIRGEFHFWNWNAYLMLHEPRASTGVSFCDAAGISSLRNARNGSIIPLGDISYSFSTGKDADPMEVIAGNVQDLGEYGCQPLRLRRNARYWIEVDAGPSYYLFQGWFDVGNTIIRQVSIPLYPRSFRRTVSFGFSLQSCANSSKGFQLFLKPTVRETPGNIVNVILEQNGSGSTNDASGSGFSTLLMQTERALVSEDRFSVLVKDNNFPSPGGLIEGGCANIIINVDFCMLGQPFSVLIGEYTSRKYSSPWWHAFDVFIRPDGLSPREEEYSIGIIDEMMNPGPSQSGSARLDGLLLNASYYKEVRPLFRTVSGKCSRTYAQFVLKAFDAVTGHAIRNGNFFLNSREYRLNETSKWIEVRSGTHTVNIVSPGYAVYSLLATVKLGSTVSYHEVRLVPLKGGGSYAFLNWDSKPKDLDLYVIPVGGRSRLDPRARWFGRDEFRESGPPLTQIEGQRPYMWWGLNKGKECDCAAGPEDCSCGIYELPPSCNNVRTHPSSDPAQIRRSLARGLPETDPRTLSLTSTLFDACTEPISSMILNLVSDGHGIPARPSGFVLNPPEIASFHNLQPGYYLIYVNAPDGEMGPFEIDIWLGDGNEDVSFVDSVAVTDVQSEWVLVGYIEVLENPVQCAGANQVFHTKLQTCQSWFSLKQTSQYPLDYIFTAISFSFSYVDPKFDCSSLDEATYRVFIANSCGCDQVTLVQSGMIGPIVNSTESDTCMPANDVNSSEYLKVWIGVNRKLSQVGTYSLDVSVPGYFDWSLSFNISLGTPYDDCGVSELSETVRHAHVQLVKDRVSFIIKHASVQEGEYLLSRNKHRMDDLKGITILVFYGSSCSCWNELDNHQVPGDCTCFGYPKTGQIHMTSGRITINEDSFQAEFELTEMSEGRLCPGRYWFLFQSSIFYTKVVPVNLTSESTQSAPTVTSTMVERVGNLGCTFCIRAVLEWGLDPLDLDFRVLNIEPNVRGGWKPEGCQNANEVFWNDERGPKWGGVTLDIDAQQGYGPETITFDDGVQAGFYNLAVNIYTTGDESSTSVFGDDAKKMIVISIYGGEGLISVQTPSQSVKEAKAWWVGRINRTNTGYVFEPINLPVKKFDRCNSDVECEASNCSTW